MAHMMKMTKSASGHMFNHYARSDDLERSAYVIRGNENIKPANTVLNYNLASNDQPKSQLDFLHQRLSEVKVHNRKDVNVMINWVVTLPQSLKDKELENQERFFKEAYKFLNDRYGKENVISAYVHMDETTPHMHYAFVPVVEDKKKGGYKLSAKEVVTREDLRTFHKDLSEHMERVFGRDIGILNEATKVGNKSIKELKRLTSQKDLEEIRTSIKKIEEITPQKSILGGVKGIEIKDIDKLKKIAIRGIRNQSQIKDLKKQNARLIKEIKLVKSKIPSTIDLIRKNKEEIELRMKAEAFDRLPDDLKKQLLSEKKSKIRELTRER